MYFELAVNDGEFKPIKTIKSKKSNNKMNFRDWRFRIRRNREPTARPRYQEPPERVIECQKELADIVEITKNKETELSDNSDQFVLNKLKEMGYKE